MIVMNLSMEKFLIINLLFKNEKKHCRKIWTKFDDDGEESLLVSYASGGLTPGDAYLWRVGPDGTPTAWKLWVSILPIGGVETSWEGWVTLDTGARISTRHAGPLGLTLELTDVEGAATLDALVDGPDPFAPLFEREEGD